MKFKTFYTSEDKESYVKHYGDCVILQIPGNDKTETLKKWIRELKDNEVIFGYNWDDLIVKIMKQGKDIVCITQLSYSTSKTELYKESFFSEDLGDINFVTKRKKRFKSTLGGIINE